MIYAPLVLVTALLSARSSADWIPDVNVISDSAEDQHLLADGRRRLRAHDGATEESNEERVGTPPHLDPEFLASSMRKGESSANTLVPHLGSTMPSLTSVTVPLSSNVQMKEKAQLRKQIHILNKRDDVDPKVKEKLKVLAKDPGSLGKTKEELLKRAEDAVIDDMDPKIIDKLQALAKDPGSIGKTREELLKRAKDAVIDDKFNRLKSDKSFTQRMAQLGFNVGDAKVAVQWLRKQLWFLKYDDYTLYLMALGSEYFKEAESLGANIMGIDNRKLLKAMGKYASSDEFKHWMDRRKDSLPGVLGKLYGKMSLLKRDVQLKLLEGEELANMAFGSELLKMREINLNFPPLIKNKDKIETLDLLDLLDRPATLKIAKDAVLDDKLNRLKSDKSFKQRMAQLGFNVGDANVAVQWLREELGLLEYDDYTLYLMALGSEYFKEAESLGANIKAIDRLQLPKAMEKYASSDEFKRWKDMRKDSLYGLLKKVHGKMRWLKRDGYLSSLEDEELANMAFGSELFKMRKIKLTFPPLIKDRDKIETFVLLDRPINQLPKGGNGVPDVKQKAKDVEDPKTLIGTTAKQLKRKAIDEASGVSLDEETNKKEKVA